MPRCPICETPGAYIGFSTIECRNPKCEHFVFEEAKTCGCCGGSHDSTDCPTGGLTERYDDSGGNGPPSSYSASSSGSVPPDYC